MKTLSEKRMIAGRRGGVVTLARHGRAHFKKIGAIGAKVFHDRYRLEPVYLNDFAIVNRVTNEVKAYLSGMLLEN
jgi:hypothetical protein